MSFFKDATTDEINKAVTAAQSAFLTYRNLSLKKRADFMRLIAAEMAAGEKELVAIAMQETHLPEPRLQSEFKRTIFQLTSYAAACETGNWLEARIDTVAPDKNPSKPDIRKSMLGLGPVVVFGASNFPFAYSTAGGDTACALAAGCPVIVKAHPAHAQTSEKVAAAVLTAAKKSNLPEGIFAHIHGAGFETGQQLVTHPLVKAVGFTGSYSGGKALFDWANQRKEPIPVFAEMGSINPVYLFPEGLAANAETTAEAYASSITLSVGQFCTNPGLIVGINSVHLDTFIEVLSRKMATIPPADMLHPGIAKAFAANRAKALAQQAVTNAATSQIQAKENQGIPTLAVTTADNFLKNKVLHQEVFGPYSLVVRCNNIEELLQIASQIEGQLTSTIIATESEMLQHIPLVDTIKDKCGRIIVNGVPTGVEVCLSMHHGGPFPATTDARFTSVGADGIKRFCRPVSYQNWPDALLPDELKDKNPLQIFRTINNELTRSSVNR